MTCSTERLHPAARGLDALPGSLILARLLAAQAAAVTAVEPAIAAIEAGARLMARAIRGGGRLVYAGAGSSALMASADGLELCGTFGIDPARIGLLMAGGLPVGAHMPGGAEDDTRAGALAAAGLGAGDVVIAVTASGRHPGRWALRGPRGDLSRRKVGDLGVQHPGRVRQPLCQRPARLFLAERGAGGDGGPDGTGIRFLARQVSRDDPADLSDPVARQAESWKRDLECRCQCDPRGPDARGGGGAPAGRAGKLIRAAEMSIGH